MDFPLSRTMNVCGEREEGAGLVLLHTPKTLTDQVLSSETSARALDLQRLGTLLRTGCSALEESADVGHQDGLR